MPFDFRMGDALGQRQKSLWPNGLGWVECTRIDGTLEATEDGGVRVRPIARTAAEEHDEYVQALRRELAGAQHRLQALEELHRRGWAPDKGAPPAEHQLQWQREAVASIEAELARAEAPEPERKRGRR